VLAGAKVVVVKTTSTERRRRRPAREGPAAPGEAAGADGHLSVDHGVFEEEIKEICAIVHEHGGQVYMDGAT